jgi:hypothetical protein
MDKDKVLDELNWWNNNYQVIADYNLVDEKLVLGDKEGNLPFL